MPQYGSWEPYSGTSAIVLALLLLLIAVLLAVLGTRIGRPLGVLRPGKAVSAILVLMFVVSWLSFTYAVGAYGRALQEQVGKYTLPSNPITPVTFASAVLAFIVIAVLWWRKGRFAALASAGFGAMAGAMIFELPFDIIVVSRVYSPTPIRLYRPLFFVPLFLVEIATFALLTLSPYMKVSKATLFALAGMFVVFAAWGLAGFSYPSSPLPTALNDISKVLAFMTALTLFLPGNREVEEARA